MPGQTDGREASKTTLPRRPRTAPPVPMLCGWFRPKGWCKGEAKKAGGRRNTDDPSLRVLGPVEKGGLGSGPAVTRQLAAHFINATVATVLPPFDDIMVSVVQLRFEYLQVAPPGGQKAQMAPQSS